MAGPRGLVLGRERCGTEHGMYEARSHHFTTRVDSNAININGEGRYLVTDSSLWYRRFLVSLEAKMTKEIYLYEQSVSLIP